MHRSVAAIAAAWLRRNVRQACDRGPVCLTGSADAWRPRVILTLKTRFGPLAAILPAPAAAPVRPPSVRYQCDQAALAQVSPATRMSTAPLELFNAILPIIESFFYRCGSQQGLWLGSRPRASADDNFASWSVVSAVSWARRRPEGISRRSRRTA
jgi:hypothetical protein